MFFKKPTPFSPKDIDSVIKACLENNAQAQKALIKLFYGYSKSICLRYASGVEEAEEIINDGFLKVFTNLHKYDFSQPFKAWMRTIMVNTAIDYYRKWQKTQYHQDVDEIDVVDLNEDIIGRIAADEILKLVQQLSPAYRMVFTMYVIDGYNHREIAEMLGIKEGTSKSNLQDARKKLQQLVKNTYPHLYLAYTLKTDKIHEN
ncbi:MAG: RNA polymerase sigma factor [Bacteroidetes bacterium]|nr:RNA polymerase sigma factor [Bacteroidota bacterium]